MFCNKCGNKILKKEAKFCAKCGTSFSARGKQKEQKEAESFSEKRNFFSTKGVVWAIIIIVVVGLGIYGSTDEEAVETNNEAMSSFNAGDNEQAISQLKQASNEASKDDTKLNTLKNLGYVYSTESQYALALESFKKALAYANKDSFDYFLVSGEVALLEGKPSTAQINYNKAYQLRPNDYQINNALALFYLDMEETAPSYVDYPKALSHAKKAYETVESGLKESAKENLAIVHFYNENYSEAISLMSTINFNQYPYMAYWMGLAYVMIEDDVNAKFYLQKAMNLGEEIEPEFYDYYNLY
ncbi:zinc-ribbon domain-containing protein [Patescibacteria group bacterium]|nr:zinc-ribbon domain-containing protein [Patescibacteria group bacterium]